MHFKPPKLRPIKRNYIEYSDENNKCVKGFSVTYIKFIVCLLHVSATFMAIFREVQYKGYITKTVFNR